MLIYRYSKKVEAKYGDVEQYYDVYLMQLFGPKAFGCFQLFLDSIQDHLVGGFCLSIGLRMNDGDKLGLNSHMFAKIRAGELGPITTDDSFQVEPFNPLR